MCHCDGFLAAVLIRSRNKVEEEAREKDTGQGFKGNCLCKTFIIFTRKKEPSHAGDNYDDLINLLWKRLNLFSMHHDFCLIEQQVADLTFAEGSSCAD